MVDLSKFKKVHTTKEHTMLQHDDGHCIYLAHGGLSKEQMCDLSALPYHKMNKGGQVPPPPPPQEPKLDKQKVSDFQKGFGMSKGGSVGNAKLSQSRVRTELPPPNYHTIQDSQVPAYADGGEVTQRDMTQAEKDFPAPFIEAAPQQPWYNRSIGEMLGPDPVAQATAALNTPIGRLVHGDVNKPEPALEAPGQQEALPQAPLNQQNSPLNAQSPLDLPQSPNYTQQGFNQALSAEKEMGRLSSQQAKRELGLAEQQGRDIQTLQSDFKQTMARHEEQKASALEAALQGKINPNQYMENLSTTGKVSTIFGLILGGLGGGATGGVNLAAKALNEQIDRDINSQKANLDQKNTIYKFYQQQTKDDQSAYILAKDFQQDLYANKLVQDALKTKDPMAIQRANEVAGMLKLNKGPEVQQALAKATLMKAAQKGTASPETLVPLLVPKEHQNAVFKEIEKSQNAARSRDEILKQFDLANKENTIVKTGAGTLRTPPSVKILDNLLLPLIKDQEGRVTPIEVETAQKLVPKPGDLPSTIKAKREGMIQFINSKLAAPTAKSYGIDLDKYKSTTRTPKAEAAQGSQVEYKGVRYNVDAHGNMTPVK